CAREVYYYGLYYYAMDYW
nr:immunoglobulin heavy chain junction region [Mus musculus]MBK4195366.1 immunoglobulin heavy chain junction region [Mus musculus]MBK4195367.1 immunoglobulin heavy chain junction region [Mus musculus]MBK4195368.1 immunoglobulin heavy chain junction region [Mus musculus]MBK4195369.1 immunoglobulin heavy chain junction region [Mus musculus]